MKIIEVDEELYQFIASQTQSIGESASDILRRLLNLSTSSVSSTALDFSATESAPVASHNASQRLESALETKAVSEQVVASPAKPISKKQPEQAIQ
ncbi:MAG: hypothetical protein HUJ63_10775, partial [Enterococcus sp.]|nr:hypothetical protein [Enterococcus sp.]